jgi:hypothetical protein
MTSPPSSLCRHSGPQLQAPERRTFVLCRARVTRAVVEDLELTREKDYYHVLSVL